MCFRAKMSTLIVMPAERGYERIQVLVDLLERIC